MNQIIKEVLLKYSRTSIYIFNIIDIDYAEDEVEYQCREEKDSENQSKDASDGISKVGNVSVQHLEKQLQRQSQ